MHRSPITLLTGAEAGGVVVITFEPPRHHFSVVIKHPVHVVLNAIRPVYKGIGSTFPEESDPTFGRGDRVNKSASSLRGVGKPHCDDCLVGARKSSDIKAREERRILLGLQMRKQLPSSVVNTTVDVNPLTVESPSTEIR